jgi:antitoxin component of MazEF toxin-antitoxin module
MNKYTATVIKTGNSYALRVPKQYVENAQLHVGQKVGIDEPQLPHKQDNAKLIRTLKELQAVTAAAKAQGRGLGMIKDPVAWQREIRKDRPLPGRE